MVKYNYHNFPAPYTAPRGEYAKYYANSQLGGTLLPAYGGLQRQRGHGLFGTLAQYGIPILKKVGKAIAPHLLKTGKGLLTDALLNRDMKGSVKKRGLDLVKDVVDSALNTTKSYINKAGGPPPPKRQRVAGGRGRVSASKKKKTLF